MDRGRVREASLHSSVGLSFSSVDAIESGLDRQLNRRESFRSCCFAILSCELSFASAQAGSADRRVWSETERANLLVNLPQNMLS